MVPAEESSGLAAPPFPVSDIAAAAAPTNTASSKSGPAPLARGVLTPLILTLRRGHDFGAIETLAACHSGLGPIGDVSMIMRRRMRRRKRTRKSFRTHQVSSFPG